MAYLRTITPPPILCDACRHAQRVRGEFISIVTDRGIMDVPQRYCTVYHVALHLSGRTACNAYMMTAVKEMESDDH